MTAKFVIWFLSVQFLFTAGLVLGMFGPNEWWWLVPFVIGAWITMFGILGFNKKLPTIGNEEVHLYEHCFSDGTRSGVIQGHFGQPTCCKAIRVR